MSSGDMIQLPKSVWRLRIAQTGLAIFVLGLTAYLEYYYAGDYQILVPLATACFTLLVVIYYYIALSGSQKLYSWVLLFLLECIAVVSWIVSTVLAALLCRRMVHLHHEYLEYEELEEHEDEDGEKYRREEGQEYEEYDGLPTISYLSTSSVIVGLCAIQLILYGFTLALIFVYRRRKAITTSYYGGKGY